MLALHHCDRPVSCDLTEIDALVAARCVSLERQPKVSVEDIPGQVFEIDWRQRAEVVIWHLSHTPSVADITYRGIRTKTTLPFPTEVCWCGSHI